MWILKNSKELLENLNSNSLASAHIIKTGPYDFSTLYTTIPHSKLKSRLTELIRNAFRFKNSKRRYEYNCWPESFEHFKTQKRPKKATANQTTKINKKTTHDKPATLDN